MSISDALNAALQRMYASTVLAREGSARHQLWRAEDGWYVGYTTERIEGGPHDGKFATLAYKPNRRKDPDEWERVYYRGFATRKGAKARALVMYGQHSPRWAARGKGG